VGTRLPGADDDLWLTDSGLETDLIFNHGWDLPEFASFPLVENRDGREALSAYYLAHLDVAAANERPMVLETPTWRANQDWGQALGYDEKALAKANAEAVRLVRRTTEEHALEQDVLISGNLGPRADAYRPEALMTADEAADYHARQMGWLTEAGADLLTALTLTYPDEAIGIARAGKELGLPVVLSFTVETDGRLPTGSTLAEAITAVDAATAGSAAYFMVNCAHPTHIVPATGGEGTALQRVRGLRANASRMSHAELDEMTELDDGDPVELAQEYASLRESLPALHVFGGCCGTDVRHVAEMARTLS
jgi:S-methylmethionine-dependent homocysteine/selenocysteine methylase